MDRALRRRRHQGASDIQTIDDAARFLASVEGWAEGSNVEDEVAYILDGVNNYRMAYRHAAKKLHPDVGGDEARVQTTAGRETSARPPPSRKGAMSLQNLHERIARTIEAARDARSQGPARPQLRGVFGQAGEGCGG